MDGKTLRAEVDSFRLAEALDRRTEDCFPAWYLKHTFGISGTAALQQSSDPCIIGSTKGDFGLDGYHLAEQADGRFRLSLIQAKFTDSQSLIAKGFRELGHALRHVAAILNGESSPAVENKVFVNLRRDVQSQLRSKSGENVPAPYFELQVIHLNENDPHLIRANSRNAIEELKEEFCSLFPDAACTVEPIGPAQMSHADIVRPSNDWFCLRLSAVPLTIQVDQRQVTMYSGIGYLSELVELYNSRRDDLFSKNVRYFLRSKRNVEKGPAGKIRDTLKAMCNAGGAQSLDPELFAFLHNGVTIFAREVRVSDDSPAAQVREPFVLNGCQTIKTGFYFRSDSRLRAKVDEERWNRIRLPVRIITTRNEDLIRQITVSNNRQNQIAASALHANDPVQVQLAERFKQHGVFYQRQEGAFAELEESSPALLETEYPQTNGGYVDMEDLARCLAAIAGELDFAHSPGRIFEYDAAYERCFSQRRLRSIVFLTFLQNVHNVLSLVLKKDLGLTRSGNGLRPSRLTYYVMCLLMRHLAKERKRSLVIEHGTAISRGSLRSEIAKVLDNYHSGIKRALQEKFLEIDDTRSESLKDAFRRAEVSLRLKANIDPFEEFADLDETVA